MQTYLDDLMRNHPMYTENYDTEQVISENTDDFLVYQYGGEREQIKTKPTGSFPPIFPKTNKEKEQIMFHPRSKSNNINLVSIADILEEKKDTTPFISL